MHYVMNLPVLYDVKLKGTLSTDAMLSNVIHALIIKMYFPLNCTSRKGIKISCFSKNINKAMWLCFDHVTKFLVCADLCKPFTSKFWRSIALKIYKIYYCNFTSTLCGSIRLFCIIFK